MPSSLAIGDFSKATHLTVKTLRHYHEAGLLEPAEVDPQSGYRRYSIEQIATAQIIRRFRDLDMPLKEIEAVMTAPDIAMRNNLIAAHLQRLEGTLAQTQRAVASLRGLLENPTPALKVVHRRVAATPAAAITDVVELKDLGAWFRGAFGELAATLAVRASTPLAPRGGIYANALFTDARGEATVFIPCVESVRAIGRVRPMTIPAVELAIIEHRGNHTNIDIGYGSLATHVSQHAIGLEGPIREYYLVGQAETSEEAEWRTEIGWPIFQTA